MKQLTKIFAITIFASFISISFAQEVRAMEKMEGHKMEMKKESQDHMTMDSSKSSHKHIDMKDHKNMKMDSSKTNKESWVREGEIDLKAIDKNKDGKVFQDMMDWNVISDEAGECPLCGMNLKEVTIEKAKENLVKHNFKVKE
ncbi:MAG: heavy metal-binding domain-containing protein [Ignavibacteria bacterium]|jgi:hypothetical protein|nr:heavy metal-binding domain-containing protein [Ignavibacteria bacterium]